MRFYSSENPFCELFLGHNSNKSLLLPIKIFYCSTRPKTTLLRYRSRKATTKILTWPQKAATQTYIFRSSFWKRTKNIREKSSMASTGLREKRFIWVVSPRDLSCLPSFSYNIFFSFLSSARCHVTRHALIMAAR
jgi:hypothetical protein